MNDPNKLCDSMVWQSHITTEEANELISILSENVRMNLLARTALNSQLFPVSTYISLACHQLYDQSFQYNACREMVEHAALDPRAIGPKCKTPGAILNGLAFQSFAMLYLHGRGQCIYDMGGPEHEPEEKREETKYLLDFFRHLNPNYRNDGCLLVDQSEDKNMRVLDGRLVESLREDMFDASSEQTKKFKRVIALIMNYGFLDKCECRMGIFEHGPYELDTGELLIFKEFQFALNQIPGVPVPNLILAYTLKNMNSLQFNDWGTLFADPTDFSNHMTKLGMWTHEFVMPAQIEYPTKMGRNIPITWETFEQIGKYSQTALTQLYRKVVTWDYERRCLAGANLYATMVMSGLSLFAKSPRVNLSMTKKTRSSIPTFRAYPDGSHPWGKRYQRSEKEHKEDPVFYLLTD